MMKKQIKITFFALDHCEGPLWFLRCPIRRFTRLPTVARFTVLTLARKNLRIYLINICKI